MKVVYTLCQGSGGLPHYTAELANKTADYADVSVIKPTETTADEYFSSDIDIREPFEPLNISVPKIMNNEISITTVLTALRSYSNIDVIHDIDPDIVHLTASTELFPYMKYFMWQVNIDSEYPVVETFHNIDPDKLFLRLADLSDVDTNNPLKWLFVNNMKNMLSKALPTPDRAHSIVHTDEHFRRLNERGVPEEDISIIPHGIYEIFQSDEIDEQTEENSILFFGNVVERKGPDTLVEAVPLIREYVPDITVVFAGSGSFDDKSQRIMDEYSENFEVHDRFIPNEEVGEFHDRAQLIAFPHKRLVGTSGTLTVAYSFEKPVISSSVGSFPDLVAEPGCGFVVPPDDPEALANGILTILRNESIYRTMAENTKRVREELSWEHIAEDHIDLYSELLSETDHQ